MLILKNLDILCVSTSDWKHPFGSKQQIMQRLSANNKVIFVESQLSILHGLKYPILFLNKLVNSFKGLWSPVASNKNLFVFSPPPVFLPFENYFLNINSINQKILLFFLKSTLKKIDFKPAIFWTFHPRSVKLFKKLGESVSIYHCIDEYSSEKFYKSRINVLSVLEQDISKKADIVFVCSRELLRLKSKLRSDAVLLLPGVDLNNFENPGNLRLAPQELKNIKSPRIGYAGCLDRRLDTELIYEIAIKRPNWSIVLIGPNRLRRKSNKILKGLKNIYFLGKKSSKEVPAYLLALDICFLPYFIDMFTKYIFPLKLFECLVTGKPVVSSALPDLVNYNNFINICKNSDEFISTIEKILLKGKIISQEQITLARDNSWDKRIIELTDVLSKNFR